MNTITIDCGASFLKGALFVDGKSKKVTQYCSPKVHNGQDIFETWQITQLSNAVKKMIVELAHEEKEIRLCIANEMHGFILCHADGAPYTDYISWQVELGALEVDGRTAVSCLSGQEALQTGIRHTGMPLRAGLPSCNLLYLKRLGHLSDKGENLYFYTLGDCLIRILSGKSPCIHPTNAAATGLYDLRTGDWDKDLIDYVANKDIIFPQIGTEEISFFLEGINIHALPAIGDQQAALLGAGVQEGDLSFNLGTGAQVSRIVSKTQFGSDHQLRPFFKGKYLQTIPFLPSGRALNVYFRFVKSVLEQYGVQLEDSDIYAGLLSAEEQAQNTDMICDLSFFENAVTDDTQGAITCIGENVFTIGNLMRAVLSQMAENFLVAAGKIVGNPEEIERIVFSGGVARRVEDIRRRILESYPNKRSVIAQDETLTGLFLYGNSDESRKKVRRMKQII